MIGILYSLELKENLSNIVELAKELQKEDPSKSAEQFNAEIEFIIVILKETALMVD